MKNVTAGRALAITTLLILAVSLAATEAAAECDRAPKREKNEKRKNYRTVIGPDGKKTFVIEKAFVVCGKVPRPTVIYAFQAKAISYEWATLKKSFTPRILQSAKDPVF